MEEDRYWALIAQVWQQVDGGALGAALGVGEAPATEAIEDGFRRFVPAMVEVLGALSLEDALAALERHRACVQALDHEAIMSVVGAWMYDNGESLAIVVLLGEPFFRRAASDPAGASVLVDARALEAIGGWKALCEPVRTRWRAALLAEIPDQFDDVAYPGDGDVSSGDWSTDEDIRYFCGKDWRDLDRSALHRRASDTSFFKPAGLHYLLPAFLMAVLEDVDGSRVCGQPISEALVFKLSHGYMHKCVALMSVGQKQVLGSVLRLQHEGWEHGPLTDRPEDLQIALDTLDPSKPFVRRPRKRRS